MKATSEQVNYLKTLVNKVFKGKQDFISKFVANCNNIEKSSASIMISGLKQELSIKRLPFSLQYGMFNSNIEDIGLPKFMNEYYKFLKSEEAKN